MRSSSEAKDLLKKVKKMSKYAEELEDVLEDCMEEEDDDDDADYREDDEVSTSHRRGRRRYRKM
jgi:hypothetical protein